MRYSHFQRGDNMKDRAEDQNKLNILEAKHIQALSSHDQEIFLQLFYKQVKDLALQCFWEYDVDHRFKSKLPSITHIEQLSELLKSIRSIPTPSVEYNPDELLAYYVKLEDTVRVSLQYKDKWLKELDDENDLLFLKILIFIQERYLNLNKKYEIRLPYNNYKIDELKDFYTDPIKYITKYENEVSHQEILSYCNHFVSEKDIAIKMETLKSYKEKILNTMKKYPHADPLRALQVIRHQLLDGRNNDSEERVHVIVSFLQSVLEQATFEKNAKEKLSAKALFEQSFFFHPEPSPKLLASPPKPTP